jgi:hypothetical protein
MMASEALRKDAPTPCDLAPVVHHDIPYSRGHAGLPEMLEATCSAELGGPAPSSAGNRMDSNGETINELSALNIYRVHQLST